MRAFPGCLKRLLCPGVFLVAAGVAGAIKLFDFDRSFDPAQLTARRATVAVADRALEIKGALPDGGPAAGRATLAPSLRPTFKIDLHPRCPGSDVYIPATYLIIVECTGSDFCHKVCHSPGSTDRGTMAYGLARGETFNGLNLPFINADGWREQIDGWGNVEKDANDCVVAVHFACDRYGGAAGAVFFVGFSRSEIPANDLARRDDRSTSRWLASLGTNPGRPWKLPPMPAGVRPTAVRHAWRAGPTGWVSNVAGLPAAPFPREFP